jgi:hypothetical protein
MPEEERDAPGDRRRIPQVQFLLRADGEGRGCRADLRVGQGSLQLVMEVHGFLRGN